MNHSQSERTETKEELERLLAQKEQERRNVQETIDNLVAVIAKNPEANSKALLERIKSDELRRDQILEATADLKKRRDAGGRVIELGQAFKLFGRFRNGFERLEAHKQREILRDIVRKIVIEREGARVFYYSLPQEDLLRGIAMGIEPKLLGNKEDGRPTGSDPLPDAGSSNDQLFGGGGNRTPVRK